MNSVSRANANAYGLHNRGALSNSSSASSSNELYVNSYSSLDAGLSIQTRDGDVISLSTSQHSGLEAYDYNSRGVVGNGDGYAATGYNVREITLNTGETFSFTVEGDLSEEELADVESIISGVDNIIGKMMDGDLMNAVSDAMNMGYYDSISSYEADITVKSGYAVYSENQTSTTGAPGQDLASAYLENSDNTGSDTDGIGAVSAADNQEVSFMDQLAELLEKQREESLARAREPLSSLFNYYLETQDTREDDDASEARANEANALVDESGTDKAKADKSNSSFSDLLDMAARTVDRTIANMMKNAFDNSLKAFI